MAVARMVGRTRKLSRIESSTPLRRENPRAVDLPHRSHCTHSVHSTRSRRGSRLRKIDNRRTHPTRGVSTSAATSSPRRTRNNGPGRRCRDRRPIRTAGDRRCHRPGGRYGRRSSPSRGLDHTDAGHGKCTAREFPVVLGSPSLPRTCCSGNYTEIRGVLSNTGRDRNRRPRVTSGP